MAASTDGGNSSALAAAVTAASLAAPVVRWTTPADTAGHRARLRELVDDTAATRYPEEFRFPEPDTGEALARIGQARRLADRIEDQRLADLVREDLDGLREHVAVIASRDAARLSEWARARTGLPTPDVLRLSEKILAEPPPTVSEVPTETTHHLVEGVWSALEGYGFDAWTVEVESDMGARASIVGTRRAIRIRAGLELTSSESRRLVAHEIGGHVLRWENAWRQSEPLLALPLGNAIATEEGLAVLLEQKLGVIDKLQLRTYAARVVAVDHAREHGILDVARLLAPSVGAATATEIALRVKRGLVDPNVPGGPTKDHGYLSGFLAVRDLDRESVRLLRASKWPHELLPELRRLADMGRMRPPAFLADPAKLGLRPRPRRLGRVGREQAAK